MVGDLDKSSFSNIEQQSLEFVKYTLDPWVIRWEQALKKSLFLPEEKKEFFIKLNVDGLLRGDYQSRMNGYAIGRQNGWLSTNDIREMEDMNPLPEEEGGNLYLVNGAMTKLKDTAEMKKAIEMLDEVKESIMNAYEIKTGLNRTKISHLMDAESWFNAKKAVELGFADEILFDKGKEENPEEKEEEKEEELEAILFSRSAVTNSFFNKLIPGKPEKKVNISELEKRLSLLKP